MLWFHPVFQALATLVGLYVLWGGVKRGFALHAKVRLHFEWQRHVFWGKVVCCIWLFGMLGGAGLARFFWGYSGLTEKHFYGALVMLPFLLIGYVTGHILDTRKKKRIVLPLFHGLNNLVLLGCAGWQLWTGYDAVMLFLL